MSRHRVKRGPFAVVAEGTARCVLEPRNGEHGLEGYNEQSVYRFERVAGPQGRHIRVYPGSADPEKDATPGYFETCGSEIFTRYFSILEERSA